MTRGVETNGRPALPPLYPIIDFSSFAALPDPIPGVALFARQLIAAGATLIQFRDKSQPANLQRFLSCSRELRRITWDRATLIINDRVDLCLAAHADGVHLGQDDLSPAAARKIFDQVLQAPLFFAAKPAMHSITPQTRPSELSREKAEGENTFLIGFSTHNIDHVRAADHLPIDYIAIGPVFATSSKANPDPPVGLEGVRAARRVTTKPLVAIGGITRQNCRQVREAGADSVAVISDLFESPGKAVADFLRILG